MHDDKIYVAITGTKHCYGTDLLKPGQLVHLKKDPDNIHDQEAIRAIITPIGTIGYVANSTHTVPKGCWSAGRIYDKFEETTTGIVRFVVKDLAIVEVIPDMHEIYMVYKKGDHPLIFPE